MDVVGEDARTGRREAAGAGQGDDLTGTSTAVPGVERGPTPVVAHACGTR